MTDTPRLSGPAGWMSELKICVGLLTRLPVSVPDGADVAAAARFFPVVGLGVGAAGALVLGAAMALGLPSWGAALLGLAAMTVVTGALHEDGLADSCDGLGARGGSAEEILAAMRDSRIGAFGVLGLIFGVGLRWAGLGAVASAETGLAVLAIIAAASVSRSVLPGVMHFVAPARTDGMSASAGRPAYDRMIAAAAIGVAIAVACLGFKWGLAAFALSALLAWALARYAQARLGGQTGDVLGAIQQLTEAAVLLIAAAALT